MPSLELHHVDGTVETRPLSRTQPLMVGRQAFNDVCVPDEGVAAMHCRVLWNKTTFEVTAATAGGVEVNGTSVAHARLQNGDVIRVGSLDLVYVDESVNDIPESSGYRLQEPDEVVGPRREHSSAAKSAQPEAGGEPPRADGGKPHPASPAPAPPAQKPIDEMSLFEGPVYSESQEIPEYEAASGREAAGLRAKPKHAPGLGATLRLDSRGRPGEQDVFKSPLVLGLSVGGLVLVLVAGIFWFLIGREQASRLYDRAVAELNDGQYAQSVASFEQFLQQYTGHSLHRQAERGLGRALVQKELAGAAPSWKRGLEQLQALISRHRNDPDFAELHPILHRFGEEISLGAARSAETARDPTLLTVSEDAQVVLERFADPASPPTAALARIKEARVAAVIAIGKQKLFDDGMAAVDAALAAGQPMVALSEREKLVRAFDGFAGQKRVKEALQKALDLERSLVVVDDADRAAEMTDPARPDRPPALGLFHTRTRTEESSQGQVVYVLAKDCCYAVDTVTGELAWRRITGFDPPFFPVPVSGSRPGLLVFDSYHQSLICCLPATGELIWRQPLEGRPRSAPLIHEGQIYLPTDDRSLCRIDLETGRLTERARFSQNLHGPPTLSMDGSHLLIPGEMSMIYAMSMRPLAAAATTFTDHAAGSLAAPPLALGKLLLLCENDKADSANLRLWDAGNPRLPLVELAGQAFRMRGQVREPAVLRGNQLVVPASGEQLAAFTVTDDPGRAGLVPVAQYQVREDEDSLQRATAKAGPVQPRAERVSRIPLYLALGADQQVWGAGSAFRHFEIGPDSIHMQSRTVAVGIASQRLQLVGDQFFVGRKAPFHDAVIFSAADRERMTSPWRTVLGARLLEVGTARDGGAVGINEAGEIMLLRPDRLRQGGFDLKSVVELELPAGIRQPLIASILHDGRLFLGAVGDVNQLWIVGLGGQVELNAQLPREESVQSAPVLVDQGLLVPVPGRLKLVKLTAGGKAVQDWLWPAGEQPAEWKHLTRLDGDEVLAASSKGLLQRIQVRNSDIPHLAEAAKSQFDHPIDLPSVLCGDSVLLVDAAGVAHQLNWRSFDREGSRRFASPVRGHWSTGSAWLVWAGDGQLHSLAEGRDLPLRWSLDLKGLEPAGTPLEQEDQLWIACRDGTILVVQASSGTELRRLRVPQTLTHGVRKLGDALYGVACDGALYRLELNEEPIRN